jgi:hypothetical protein
MLPQPDNLQPDRISADDHCSVKAQAVSEQCGGSLRLSAVTPLTSSTGDEGRDNHGTGSEASLRVLDCAEATLTLCEENRVKEANRRQQILQAFDSMVKGVRDENGAVIVPGISSKQAAKQCGESVVTIWRWQKEFKVKGYNGLLPDTHLRGRKSVIEKLGVTQEVIDQIRGLNLDTESGTSALRVFAQSDRCPENLAQVILDPNRCSKHALPPSLRKLINIPKNIRDAHRGPRTLALGGIWIPRKLDIIEGDIFCSDDTTPIWGWWIPWHESEEYPFGVKLLQGQLLPVIDVASQNPLTFALIAREKSSYRASDIWALFGHTFEEVGVPRLGMQLERGSWEANLIAGELVEYQEGEVTMSRRVGGLRQLPTNITPWHLENQAKQGSNIEFPKTLQTWTSYLPKSKSIEAFFNRSQTLEGMLWGSLGRNQMRQPYEKMKKLFQECSRPRTKKDPRQHFLSGTELAARLMEMMRYLGNEPMEGEVFSGIPSQKWQQRIEEYPLVKLPEDMRWIYKRSWKRTQITQGWARVRLTDELSGDRYSLFYCNPEQFAAHEGAEVVVYYDQQHFEQPAQIILARTGEFLCEARYEDRRGSFLAGDKSGHDIAKRWKNATMTIHATIAKHAPSRQLPAEIKARREAAKVEIKKTETTAGTSGTTAPVVVPRLPSVTRPVTPAPVTITPDQYQLQRERLARQARRANLINQFHGDE